MTIRGTCALLLCLSAGCQATYEFQPISIGQDEARVPRPRSDGQFMRSVYADVVGRAPTLYDFVVTDVTDRELNRFPVDEQRFLESVFEGVGDPAPLRALLVAGLLRSEEVKVPRKEDVARPEEYIADQFRRLLGRAPGGYELVAFAESWRRDPAVGPRTVLRAILLSREYQSF